MEQKENKMGVMPVKKLIVSMSLPMMVSMMVQALYNVVDSIFVAQIEEDALTAVTLAFPMQNLMISLAAGLGVGINAMLSKALGEKKFENANEAANVGIFMEIIGAILFMLFGFFGSGLFIGSQTSDEKIIAYGTTYLTIVCGLSFGCFMQVTFERLLQSTGKTFNSMISQATGAILNIIFDPILIFGYFGFPKLGVAGAAYATVLGQLVGACLGLFMNTKYNKEISLSIRKILAPKMEFIRGILYVGIPSVLMMAIGSVMSYFMNLILIVFSTTATAVFGVYFKLQSFFFMPVFGLNNGLIPVLAYNYGAREGKRIREALKFAMVLAVCVMIVGTIVFNLLPVQLLGLFDASEEMLRIGVPALRIISISFPVAGVCIVMGSIFQAFSKSIYSLITSVSRQLVVLLPVAYLLSRLGEVTLVWWAFPISEVASLIVSFIFFRKLYKETVLTL